MLIGEIEMSEFIIEINKNPAAMEQVINTIPKDAIRNPSHDLWKNISYDWARLCGFNAWEGICNICRFDDSIGDNLNIWGTLRAIYSYTYPDLSYTTKYADMHSLYLEAIGDCYGGPEVKEIIESIIAFHIVENKKPWWIPGAEWPRGVNSPMQYIEKKRKGEEVRYIFKDVDTGEIRTVIQYY